MNSPFANIFIGIQQHIVNTIPAINYIDQDLGQLKKDHNTLRPSVAFPCILIDFEDCSFENLSENVQTAKGNVVLRLGFAPYSNSSQSTPQDYIENAINYYDIEWDLHKTLQGWSPSTDIGTLTRIYAGTQQRTDSIRVRELRYSFAFEDYSTGNTIQQIAADINITPQIQMP